MDLDALHRHMTEFNRIKPRLLKMLEFVEGIMTSGMMPNTPAPTPTADTSSAIVTSDQLGTIRQDVTVLDDRIDVLDKFKEDVLPVLDHVPQFLALMEKMQGFDPAAIEERLTAVEGSVQDIAIALDPGSDKPANADDGHETSSDGATPGQGAAPVASTEPGPTEQPAADTAASAAS